MTTGIVDRQDRSAGRPVSVGGDDRDMHLLRLSLDLQLDAMLLVLGASAVSTPDSGIPGGGGWMRTSNSPGTRVHRTHRPAALPPPSERT
jgi:hypothetical protein